MATFVAQNTKLYVGQYNLSGDLNKVSLDWKSEAKDVTTFGAATRVRKGGLFDISLSGSGLWQAQSAPKAVDDVLFGNLALADVPITLVGQTGAEGERAFTFLGGVFDYKAPEAAIGEPVRFTFTATGTRGQILIPATVLLNAVKTATGNGTGFQLGAVSAAQSLYATLHVLAVTGNAPTLNAIVQSNVDNAWAAPTARITFAQATAPGFEAKSLLGAITDTWYRINYTIGGTASPSFTVVVTVGIA